MHTEDSPMASLSPLLLVAVILAVSSFRLAAPATIGFDFHHRFSGKMRQWGESHGYPGEWWPEKGTAEYYAALAHHDRAHHGRFLAAGDSSMLTFLDGNLTYRVSDLGMLNYAFVELGTPKKNFLVALDTGSDLFWVPCDCEQCAPAQYRNVTFNIYSPSNSTTSKLVPCSSSLCELQSSCSGASSSCPFEVQYLSVNTSSSGILVEDVLYLTTETASPDVVPASVVFGCGRVQTGAFLADVAPNGLFGLGLSNISIPSILSSQGLISNSFSMCFGTDGYGRITFGDKGSTDQSETPFNVDKKNPFYSISVTGLIVDKANFTTRFNAFVDSGTSITLLADPIYTQLATSFTAQVLEMPLPLPLPLYPDLPFNFCYALLPNQDSIYIPRISVVTESGNLFNVTDPIVPLINQEGTLFGYCLAVIKSSNVNIIGRDFLTGLRVVFDREKLVLGWKEFDCYGTASSGNGNSSSPPASAPAPSSDIPDNFKEASNKTKATAPAPSRNSSHLNAKTSLFLILFLLAVAIL
ncbi:aspartyl protease family protein 1-like [Typha angustifolia]|uniref:aspartyl protease family protein 1-like n=1 Tax=Typha angustifolia TaxID=59011 RepID=UPI003C2C6EAC